MNNTLRFNTDTITFGDIRELALLLNTFLEQTKVLEVFKTKQDIQEKPFLINIPELILKDENNIKQFYKVVEFCTGSKVDETKGMETMKLIEQTLIFIQEVDVTSFLFKMTMTFLSLIKE